jgi:pilus assembly protein CpaB
MNKRLIGVVVFALVIAGAASLLLFKLLAKRFDAQAQPAGGKVVVASRNLEIGTMIKPPDIKLVDWSGTPPPGSSRRLEDALERGVISTVYSGEPILDSRLAGRGAGAGMAAIIPVGMRAVAVRVNDVVGVAGFVTPGMRVDVLIMGNPPNAQSQVNGTLSRTLLQNIEILSAGQQIQKDAEGKPVSVPVVNMLVTPEQAEILSLASNEARIQLVLRNPLDKDQVKTPGTAMARLFTGDVAPVVRQPAPKPVPRVVALKPIVKMDPPPPAPEPEKVKPPLIVEVIHGSKAGTRKAESKFEEKTQEK